MAVNQYFRYPGLGVTSINNLVGAVTLSAGSNITITPSGNALIIAASGGGGGSGFDTIGTFDTGVATSDGLNASGTTLFAQSASASNPGMVNTTTQTLAGDKTFSGTLTLSLLTASRAVVTNGSKVLVSSATTAAEIGFVSGVTSAIQTQLDSKQATLTIGNLTDAGTDGITITGGTGAVIGTGVSIAQHVADSTHNGYLLSTDWVAFNAKQAAGNYITALTGDGTASGPGSAALTLATVNSNVGSFGSSTAIPSLTVNAKGLVTAASTNVVIAPAGTLTGTTLASNVVSSSLTSVGTIATGVWNGTTVDVAHGGSGQTSYTDGQLLIGNSSGSTLTKATLTAGSGISVTNGNGSITIAVTNSSSYFAPISNVYTAGATWNPHYIFTITSGSATATATYTNNGITFTVYATVASATQVIMYGNGVPTASGTLTKASGTGDSTITFSSVAAPLYLDVQAQGSGGAGGGAATTTAGQMSGGGGGGAGSYSRSVLRSGFGTAQTVTVGAGGTGVSGTTGNSGNASSFGSLVTASGGGGGSTSAASSSARIVSGGSGATAGTGDTAVQGGDGFACIGTAGGVLAAGSGGASFFGGGAVGATVTTGASLGGTGRAYGSGGGGSATGTGGVSANSGGPGAVGVVIVIEHYQ